MLLVEVLRQHLAGHAQLPCARGVVLRLRARLVEALRRANRQHRHRPLPELVQRRQRLPAGRIGAEVAKGDPADLKLTDVASLESAEAGDISLFSDAKYANAFAVTKASVVITSDKLANLPHGVVVLVVPNPRLTWTTKLAVFRTGKS
jgi:hypothetical protein